MKKKRRTTVGERKTSPNIRKIKKYIPSSPMQLELISKPEQKPKSHQYELPLFKTDENATVNKFIDLKSEAKTIVVKSDVEVQNEHQLEQDHLSDTYDKLMLVISELKKDVELPDWLKITSITNRDEIPFMLEERRNHEASVVYTKQKINNLYSISDEVYFSRIDIDFISFQQSYYISKTGLDSIGTTDWRSDIGALLYDTTTSDYNNRYDVILKRRFNIKKEMLLDYKDVLVRDRNNSNVTDEFLIKVLKDKKDDKRVTDIIKSIQIEQNDIIRLNSKYDITVIGCAGSGKTMILFHRLSYLSFHEKIKWDRVKIITPNNDFVDSFKSLKADLGLVEIEMMTLTDYFKGKLALFGIKDNGLKLNTEYEIDDDVLAKIYSHECKMAMFSMFSNDLNHLTELVDKVYPNKYGFFKKVSNIEKYQSLKEISGMVITDMDNEINSIFNRVNEEKSNIVQLIIRFLGKVDLIENSSTFSCLSKDIFNGLSDEHGKMHVKDVLDFYNTLNIDSLSFIDSKSILESSILKIDLQSFLSQLKKMKIEYIELSKELNKLNRTLNVFEIKIQNTEEDIKDIDRRIKLLLLRKDETIIIEFLKRQVLDGEIEDLNNRRKEYLSFLEYLKREVVKVEKERVSLTNLILNTCSVSGDKKFVLDEYNKLTNLIRELLIEYDTIVEYFNLVDLKDNMLDIKRMINVVTNLKLWFESMFIGKYVSSLLENSSSTSKSYHFYYYYLLLLLCTFESSVRVNSNIDKLICIDEFQDVSNSELDLIREVNNNTVTLNLFGDFNQKVLSKGISSHSDITRNHHNFYLRNNYRNTVEITKYYNRTLEMDDNAVGINGPKVVEVYISEINSMLDETKTAALICKKKYKDKFQKLCAPIRVLSIEEAKGLEFNTIFAYTKSMNKNERYITFSRALYRLFVIKNDN